MKAYDGTKTILRISSSGNLIPKQITAKWQRISEIGSSDMVSI
jgi:hypothetical protein